MMKYFMAIAVFFVFCTCGMPKYEVLDEPGKISYSRNAVGFSSVEEAQGYIMYYKIYNSTDSAIETDRDLFDPDNYESAYNQSIPNGVSAAEKLGFKKMGLVGESSISIPQIPDLNGYEYTIDFSKAENQGMADSDPLILVDGNDASGSIGIPARSVKYSDNPSSQAYSQDNTYKRFVKNYEYSSTRDSDIVNAISHAGGNDFLKNIKIAFVVISYKLSDINLTALTSIPIYIGTVEQNNVLDNIYNKPQKD